MHTLAQSRVQLICFLSSLLPPCQNSGICLGPSSYTESHDALLSGCAGLVQLHALGNCYIEVMPFLNDTVHHEQTVSTALAHSFPEQGLWNDGDTTCMQPSSFYAVATMSQLKTRRKVVSVDSQSTHMKI